MTGRHPFGIAAVLTGALLAGGHAFQVNFSNGIGSTIAQVARGGFSSDQWHIGFNINRKFF